MKTYIKNWIDRNVDVHLVLALLVGGFGIVLSALVLTMNQDPLNIENESKFLSCSADISTLAGAKPNSHIFVKGEIVDVYFVDNLGCANAVTVSTGDDIYVAFVTSGLSLTTMIHESGHVAHRLLMIKDDNYDGDLTDNYQNETYMYTLTDVVEAMLASLYSAK